MRGGGLGEDLTSNLAVLTEVGGGWMIMMMRTSTDYCCF